MNLVVKKYGGTSVASIAKISKIAENLIDEYNSKKKLVVVLSAMGNSTDKLEYAFIRVYKFFLGSAAPEYKIYFLRVLFVKSS